MNKVEEDRLIGAVVKILTVAKQNNTSCFVCDLVEVIDLSSINLPRKRVFDQINDILSHSDFCKTYGYWTLAEIEGLRVQFALESPDAVIRQEDGSLTVQKHVGNKWYTVWDESVQHVKTVN